MIEVLIPVALIVIGIIVAVARFVFIASRLREIFRDPEMRQILSESRVFSRMLTKRYPVIKTGSVKLINSGQIIELDCEAAPEFTPDDFVKLHEDLPFLFMRQISVNHKAPRLSWFGGYVQQFSIWIHRPQAAGEG